MLPNDTSDESKECTNTPPADERVRLSPMKSYRNRSAFGRSQTPRLPRGPHRGLPGTSPSLVIDTKPLMHLRQIGNLPHGLGPSLLRSAVVGGGHPRRCGVVQARGGVGRG